MIGKKETFWARLIHTESITDCDIKNYHETSSQQENFYFFKS